MNLYVILFLGDFELANSLKQLQYIIQRFAMNESTGHAGLFQFGAIDLYFNIKPVR